MSHAPAFTLLHGWGVDARVWQPLAPYWHESTRVSTPNWPGYGDGSCADTPAVADPTSLADTAQAMAASLPQDSIWVGWSLGGLLAVALSEHLPPPRGIILLGSGARFCAPGGVIPDALDEFTHAFQRSPAAAWRHFLRWQSSGEPNPRAALKQLTALLGKTPPADTATLAAGLGWLKTLDNRERLNALPCPMAMLAGENDPFIAPPTSGDPTANARLAQAGHCPMVSQPEALIDALVRIAAEMTPAAEAP